MPKIRSSWGLVLDILHVTSMLSKDVYDSFFDSFICRVSLLIMIMPPLLDSFYYVKHMSSPMEQVHG